MMPFPGPYVQLGWFHLIYCNGQLFPFDENQVMDFVYNMRKARSLHQLLSPVKFHDCDYYTTQYKNRPTVLRWGRR